MQIIIHALRVLEAAGLPQPISVNGVQQRPIEVVSMLYSFDDAKAAERRETQYFEMFGNRGIYHKGWTAVTKHGTPGELVGRKTVALDDDVWELYDTNKDWSQANNLAKEMPEKLHELQRLWLIEATRVTAEIDVPEKGAEGVIISQGANIGGWSLYAKNGKLKYCYNCPTAAPCR